MLHPKSRRSLRSQHSTLRGIRVGLFTALAAVALLSVQFSTSSVSSKAGSSVSGSSGRINARVATRHRASSAIGNYAPLPFAVITVDRTDDDPAALACTAVANDCSLRGAVAFANLNPGTTISLPAGAYSLNIPGGAGEGFSGNNSIGDLDISGNNTSIVGAGSGVTIIQQTTVNDRVIEVNPSVNADFNTSISGVTITGGKEGTGIGGGGIISGSINNTVTLSNCVISGNTATGAGTFGGGGVLHTGGDLTVSNCTFSSNSTSASGGGLGYSAGDPSNRQPSAGTLNVSGSTFSGNSSNSAAAGGGALDLFNFNLGNSTYIVSSSSFSNNTATNGNGGAIVVESGPLTVSTSSFSSNSAGTSGGAIMSAGTATIQYSRLVSNTAPVTNGLEIFAVGPVTANNNWWGANSGPTLDDIAGPGESATTIWLQLRHTANPNSICTGGTATLTADILDRNVGADLTTELNGLPTFPALFVNGVPALGSITAATNFVNGVATATYTAGATTGSESVEATADSETQSATINIQTNTTTDPGDQEVCEGGTATFTTTTSGPGSTTYVWKQGTTVLASGGRVAIVSSSNTSTLTITNVLASDAGTYTVEADSECADHTQSATLTVNTTPVVTLDPVSQTGTPGNSVTFTAAASGQPTPTVQWQVSVANGPFTDIPSATGTSYTFTVQASDNGNRYRAVFTNTCGSDTSASATLSTCTAPEVTGSPASVADACVGSVVNFNASATGDPAPTVQWEVSTNGGGAWSNIPGATSTTLSVTVTPAVDGNQYRAVFTNSCGTDTSAAATLGVDSIAPVITLSSNTISLWPPNHSYHTINLSDVVASTSDNCGVASSGVVITSVSSDESENGNGDGNTSNDIIIAADCKSVQLRAERQGSGNGRVYRINVRLTDTAGNVATATAKVYVPKSQNGAAAVDNGPAAGYTVNSSCP